MSKHQKAIIISGATACGKSNLALEIAKHFKGEIVNADSLQIYKDLPILSAQPNNIDKNQIKHHLYGLLDFTEESSVFLWLKEIKSIVAEIYKNQSLPIIVGGSGMYISKLVEGISIIPQISIQNKQKAKQDLDKYGLDHIIEMSKNPKIKDPQRALRAYEILLETGKAISYWHHQKKEKILPNISFIHFNLNLDRQELYKRCEARFDEMIKIGAIEEASILSKKILNQQYQIDKLPISKTLGFCELNQYLNNNINLKQLKEVASKKTRNYAKRQLTWFRNQLQNQDEHHIRININNDSKAKKEVFTIISDFLSKNC